MRVMFENFAKIGRAARASQIWQNFQRLWFLYLAIHQRHFAPWIQKFGLKQDEIEQVLLSWFYFKITRQTKTLSDTSITPVRQNLDQSAPPKL